MTTTLGTTLGVEFDIDWLASNGFILTLTNEETGEVLWRNQMIFYTVWEAVVKACHEVWADEIREHDAEYLPEKIARTLGVEEEYEEE